MDGPNSNTKRKTFYVCLEGVEGVGKTTQVNLLRKCLTSEGFTVLTTKEPGTDLVPVTMLLRNIMLDKQYESQVPPLAREFISQAIRCCHIETLIKRALKQAEYDFIIQDRGTLSGLAYARESGHSEERIMWLLGETCNTVQKYDLTIVLEGDVKECLNRAVKKKEFEKGDVIEEKGDAFMKRVSEDMHMYHTYTSERTEFIDVTNKDMNTVTEMLHELVLKHRNK